MGEDDRSVRPTTPSLTFHHTQRLTVDSSGAGLCIGGPYLIYYVTPTEEELFMVSVTNFFLLFISAHLFEFKELRLTNSQRYNPDLQRRSLENRQGKQENLYESHRGGESMS